MIDGKPVCSVIIVTHNSEVFMEKLFDAIKVQTRAIDQIILVDSGSRDRNYLKPYALLPNVKVVFDEMDIGFCKGNNIGMRHLREDVDYVLFLNPDAFLFPDFILNAIQFMEAPINQNVGMLTPTLLGYDIKKDRATGKYDSTGIFRKWYGRWYDRGQGEDTHTLSLTKQEEVPAICGALMFCRKKALDSVLIRGEEVFDNSFYMYKEDIDLSLRLKAKGWKLYLLPLLKAHHCRGWNPDRKQMPRKFRLCSARNELRIHARSRSPCVLYSFIKFSMVKVFDI